jgi:7-carboxy-7-deazaguanine synthase
VTARTGQLHFAGEERSMKLPVLAKEQRLAPLAGKPPGHLLVHEVYKSVQGESTFAGLPCVFVRLTGCPARCSWCDTPHAFKEGTLLQLETVLERVSAMGCPLVELTEGEPLAQPEALPLMAHLADEGHTVLLETSGVVTIAGVDPRVHVIMDLKCPDSGECENNHWPNLGLLKPTDQIKFVIASRKDWEWTDAVIREYRLDERFTCLVSTAFGDAKPVDLVGWLLDSRLHRVRMQLQLHTYIWDPAARGV